MGESNPSFLPWKGSVLTDRRIEHGGSFLQELPNLLAWEVCRRVATSSAMLASCVWIHTRLIEDFWINYYTSTNLARQELFCNLEVRVGIEPTNNSFADCDITILSSHYNSGTAWRNRTLILALEEPCPIHWTNAVWCGYRDSNSENSDFKSDMYTNSIISAKLWYLEWDSNSQNFSFWERRLFQFVHRGTGGLTVNWTQTQSIMSRLLYH